MKYKKRLLSLFVIATLLLSVFAGCSPQREAEQPAVVARRLMDSFAFSPRSQDETGVEVSSAFTLRCEKSLKEDDIRHMVKVSPPAAYTLEKERDGEYALRFEKELKKNTVYKVAVESEAFGLTRSFVFQTQRDFAVVSTSPADGDSWHAPDSAIEVRFSVADVDMEDAFRITPAVAGRFEIYTYTSVFIPAAPLEPSTDYTVTISGDLACKTGQTLGEDYTFSFRTSTQSGRDDFRPPAFYHVDKFSESYLSGDMVVMEFYAYNVEGEYDVSLYRYPGPDAYRDALTQLEDYALGHPWDVDRAQLDKAGLDPVASFTTRSASEGYPYSYSKHIVFPDDLEPGYYLAEVLVTAEDGGYRVPFQKLIQISDLSVYAQSLGGQSLFWLHDALTGRPLEGAAVNLYSDFDEAPQRLTADADGIAISEVTPESHAFFTVETGGLPYIDRLQMEEEPQPSGAQKYFSMSYKDREIYMPSDNINVWGFLHRRKEKFALPDYVRVKLYDGYYWSSGADAVYAKDPPLYSVDAPLAPDGSYTALLGHENLRSGSYYIAICDEDDLVIETSSLYISDYIKPDYVISSEFDRPYYTLDDPMGLSASVSFFDGTPAHTMRLHVGESHFGEAVDGQYGETDSEGKVTFDLGRPSGNRSDSWQPYYQSFRVISADSQNAQALAFPRAAVLPRDIMLESVYTPGVDSGSLSITATRVDPSGITEAAQIFENDYEAIRGAPATGSVNIKIVREELVQDGVRDSYYDFINKRTEYIYDYRTESTTVLNQNYSLSGGTLRLDDLPVPQGAYSFRLEITMQDTKGRRIEQIHYLYSSRNSSNGNYSLYFDTGRPWGEDSYGLGDTISLRIQSHGRPFDMTGTTLCTFMQDSILSHHLTESGGVQTAFSRQMIPNVTFAGAFFDGRHVYNVGAYSTNTLRYDSGEDVLDIEVTADKERYRPGEQATLTLKLRDKAGEPVSASLCVGVVDEAIFALIPQNVDPLSMLYRDAYSSYRLVTYTSYIQHRPFEEGGKGGGGGDEVGSELRDDFVDTALFWSTHTGEDGIAAVSFTVPDNLTSWRVTALAVDEDIRAGKTVRNVASSLPYFVKPLVNRRYLAGEDVVVTAKIYGDEAPRQSTVTVTLEGGEPQAVQVELQDYAQVNLGQLPVGSYHVVVAAAGGDHKDAVALDFTVVESFMELPTATPVALSEVGRLDTLSYPVTLAIYDKEYSELMAALSRMINYNPVRFEQKVAMAVAQDAAKRFSVDDNLPDYVDVSLDIAEILLDPAETPAIARACVAAPDYISRGEVTDFLYARLEDRESAEEWAAAAFMGLAALGEPVLVDVRERLKEPELAFTHRLYYAAALAALGDEEGAKAQYDQHIAPKLETRAEQTWLDVGEGGDVTFLHTSAAYFTSLLTGREEEALQMLRYLANVGSGQYTSVLENAAYVSRFQPVHTGESRFSYTHEGEKTTVDLSAGQVKYLCFSKASLASANLQAVSGGDIAATAFYTQGPDAFVPAGEQFVQLSKQISDTDRVEIGDLVDFTVTVKFAGDAPPGWYKLVDFLPTNMRFFSGGSYNMYGGNWWNSYIFREQNQKLTLWIYYNPYGPYPTGRDFAYAYTGRVMYTGRYLAESAYLLHENDLVAARTPRQNLG